MAKMAEPEVTGGQRETKKDGEKKYLTENKRVIAI